jgi:hypothetical protein
MIKSPQSSDLHSEVADFRTSQGIKLLRHDSGSERTTKPGSSSTVGGKSAQVAAATTLTPVRAGFVVEVQSSLRGSLLLFVSALIAASASSLNGCMASLQSRPG